MVDVNMKRKMKGLTDIPGILVGHASDYDGLTGCTVVLCERGGGRGRHPRLGNGHRGMGRAESDARRPIGFTAWCSREAARSAWNRPAACAVFWSTKASGSRPARRPVPIVVRARFCTISASAKSGVRPTREMGEAAAAAATDKAVVEGAVGAGTGATVGKMLGMKHAMKSGVGSWTVELDGQNAGVQSFRSGGGERAGRRARSGDAARSWRAPARRLEAHRTRWNSPTARA